LVKGGEGGDRGFFPAPLQREDHIRQKGGNQKTEHKKRIKKKSRGKKTQKRGKYQKGGT